MAGRGGVGYMDRFTSILTRGGDQTFAASPRRGAVISGVAETRVSALLCARLCHELSGSIAAINNGIELLADEDPDFAHVAVELSGRFFDGSRIACEYGDSAAVLPLDWQQLACNLLLVGAEALPRGGRLVLAGETLELEAIGEAAVLSSE